MAGNKKASEKRRQTMIKKFGSEEAYLEFMRRNAGIGGRISKRPPINKEQPNDRKRRLL